MVERTLAEDAIPAGETPIIYLPGVSKQDIRAIDSAPQLLKPLAELQYRGTLFTQQNGKDWTIAAFIQSNEGGLGIDVGADSGTKAAILGARAILAGMSVDEMRRAAPLRADIINGWVNPDLPKLVLSWLNDPVAYQASVSQELWEAFRAQCRSTYRLDPESDGSQSMVTELGLGQTDAWELAWQRFAESPEKYPGIPARLREARPKPRKSAAAPTLWTRVGRWPQENEDGESALREALSALKDGQPGEARSRLLELEEEHGPRRAWVWSRLGQAPLARALEHLAAAAKSSAIPLTASTTSGIAEQYADYGWRTDDAVLRAMAAVEMQTDVSAVRVAVRSIYESWLEHCAKVFQAAVDSGDPATAYPSTPLPKWPAGTCVVFCDGFRLDLAHRLEEALKPRGLTTALTTRLTALPSITSTAKPAVSPVAGLLGGSAVLDPSVAATGTVLTIDLLRGQLQGLGFQVLFDDETGDSSGRAWAEAKNIDNIGHNETAHLPALADPTMRELSERIGALLEAGWKQAVVVTDHGWLYLPGGLPKAELEVGLAEQKMRKGRCARLKPGANPDLLTMPWHWDPEVRIAFAPGICCFQAGKVYEHGGLSPQECVTPVLIVSKPGGSTATGTGGPIGLEVNWRGLRCDFHAPGAPADARVDIRTKAGDASTSLIGGPRALKEDGTASAPVEDDSLLGHAAFAVLLGANGVILAQAITTVGG